MMSSVFNGSLGGIVVHATMIIIMCTVHSWIVNDVELVYANL
jgi:hypothetical protein